MFAGLVSKTWIHVRCLHTTSARNAKKLPKGSLVVSRPVKHADVLLQEDETESYLDEIGGAFAEKRELGHRPARKKSAKQIEREILKRQIQQKKEKAFYTPKAPGLLTWAAKMQIVYLNKTDPIYWTPEMLANSFPASKDVVVKILKSNRVPINEDEITKHDQRVYKTWLRLKEVCKKVDDGGGTEMDENDKRLAQYGKNVLHLLPTAAGDTTQSVPPPEFAFRTQEQIAEENKPVVKPYFSAILASYYEDKERLKTTSESKGKPIGFDEDTVKMLLNGISKLGENPVVVENMDNHQYPSITGSKSYSKDEVIMSPVSNKTIELSNNRHGEYMGIQKTVLDHQEGDSYNKLTESNEYSNRMNNQFNSRNERVNRRIEYSDWEHKRNARHISKVTDSFRNDESAYQQHTNNSKTESSKFIKKTKKI